MKKVIVISLGGSLIAPDSINTKFLNKFKDVLNKNKKNCKFVVVCGGGRIARTYMKGIETAELSKKHNFQALLGIAITRLNARLLTYFFGEEANQGIPHDMEEIKNLLRKNDFVFCGALRYNEQETSDGTAAKLANFLNTDFINLTNVQGLYDKDPNKNKNAKFIPEISYKEFLRMIKRIKYKPGQHFVLDQSAAKIIKKYNITTYILGDLKQLDNILNHQHFVGTRISSD